MKSRRTSTFLWIFFVVCLCILRTNKTWDFLTWTSNITNCNSCDPEDHECGDTGQLLVFWIHFLSKSKWNWKHGHFGIYDSCFFWWCALDYYNTCGSNTMFSFSMVECLEYILSPYRTTIDPIDLGGKTATTLLKMRKCICPFCANHLMCDGWCFFWFGKTLEMCVVHICSFSRDG